MPVRNGERFLPAALQSLLQQDFGDWELILVNDGSTDRTESIAGSMEDPRIRILKNPGDPGIVNALNFGLQYCRGEYVARMDADDICLPYRLRMQCSRLDRDRALGLVCANVQSIDEEGRVISGPWWLPISPPVRWSLLWGNPVAHPTVMARRRVLTASYPAGHAEDYRLWTQLALTTEIRRINRVLLYYRLHSKSEMALYSNEHREAAAAACRSYARSRAGQEPADCHLELGDFASEGPNRSIRFTDASQWLRRLARSADGRSAPFAAASIIEDCRRRLQMANGGARLQALAALALFPPGMFFAWLFLLPVGAYAMQALRSKMMQSPWRQTEQSPCNAR